MDFPSLFFKVYQILSCFLHNHFVLKLNKAEARRGETVVNPCFNSKAAILYKAEQEEEEQRRAK